ncbi:HAD family hydrolase [Bradyrhizobium sp. WSM3983]|uniref:HAD family hydrolase n=1 Tax=Bradyrhizobium sp. WSM3983 TaxID=1038867 RepID=UPI000481971F|nr:HAD family hydrolase [Bradyrhizobium sp. WSM3983]
MTDAKIKWDSLRLVAFDVDGTLYNRRAMRLRMLVEMIRYAILACNLTTPNVLRIYRELRENMADQNVECFNEVLICRTAERTRVASETIRAIIAEWTERRPLAHIRASRYAHVVELFAALKRHGKTIGIFSDYPAVEKLKGMDLSADFIVAASDANVGILKPNPRGLKVLIEMAGVTPSETILIGDRKERDGEAALRAGAQALIRSSKPLDGWTSFASFSDPLFAPLLSP